MHRDAEAIVIGAGHNGLICAGYLGRAGLDVTILERSHRIGGACITEELVPGYKFSTFAYGAHGPGPKICRDLEVPADAFQIVEFDPTMFAPFPDGDHILLWKDMEKSVTGLERFGSRDAENFPAYCRFMDSAKKIMQSVFLSPPPTHQQLYEQFGGTAQEPALEAMLTRSHWDLLCDYFESPKIRCALARADDVGYPTAVGTLLAEVTEAASDGAGIENKSGYPSGGMGAITKALADAVMRFGVEIRTQCPVAQILVEANKAVGVRLEGGEELRARMVISNADPKRTFLKLMNEKDLPAHFSTQIKRIKTRAGYMKYHAILSDLPRFTALPTHHADAPKAIGNTRIGPTLEYFEKAWLDAQSGVPSRNPVMSMQLPTAYIPDMAPPGKHIFGSWIRYAPAQPRGATWEELKQPTMDNIVRVIEEYAPGFSGLIEWQRLYTPADIERETGITDASIRHVDMTLDQMLTMRPLPAWSAYETPVDGLYLCGSGTHPCGSVTGAPGHNAAHAILGESRVNG